MEEQKFRVDFSGILNILSKHLYSSENVFIRELLQNSVDAIALRNQSSTVPIIGKVNVELLEIEEKKLLIIEDNGIGLTLSEVEKFLSVIGSSSKKQILNSSNSFIGQFGIGLLSCFMVSKKITLITNSEKSAKAVKWVASIDGTYLATEIDEQDINIGTKIFLELEDSKTEKYSFELLAQLLKKYSQFLNLSVTLNSQDNYKIIDRNTFPWGENSTASEQEILEFGRSYFDINFNHYIPLISKDGKSQGIGYIYPFPADTAGKQSNHVYVKNMLIDESSSEILPDWAFFIKAVINSDQLKPTASRESIYKDDNLKLTREGFEHSIREYFQSISVSAPSILEEIISIHNLAIKSFAIKDNDFFELVYEQLHFPTSYGSLKAKDFNNFSQANFVSDIDLYRQILPISKANKRLLINGGYIYDSTLLAKIARKPNYHISKLDNYDFNDILNDVSWDEDNSLNLFFNMANDVLETFKCNPVLKRFQPINLPSIFHSTENNKLFRELDRTKENSSELWSGVLNEFSSSITQNSNSFLYLNIDNPLIQKIITIKDFDLFSKSLELIYLNSLMAGHYALNDLEAEKMNTNLLAIINQAINQ